MKSWRSQLLPVLGLSFLLSIGLGCGPRRVEVKGRVTYNDKPIETGAISFEPADGQGPSSGGEIKDGQYRIRGKAEMVPGTKIVRIRASRKTGRKTPVMPGSSQMVEEIQSFVPAKYNDKSTLKAEVEAGKENEFNFDLKGP